MKHGCETVYSSGVNPHLDHPNHHREWTATNLWCGRCTDFCALCCAPCCAHNGALLASYSSVNSVDEKKKAQNILAAIEKWNPIGKEETTFLTCNDCNSLVCPNCCGVCPHPVCRDLICKVSYHSSSVILHADARIEMQAGSMGPV